MKGGRLKIMIVDDSKVVLERIKFVLERAGHVVEARDTPLGTTSVVLKYRPDVLLLDVSMPALDGDRLAMLVAELDATIMVILHSSRPERELKMLGARCNARGVIHKTSDINKFLTEFNRIVFGLRTDAPLPINPQRR